MMFFLAIASLIVSTLCNEEAHDTTVLPTSCIGLEDGFHYVKLLDDDAANDIEYPILYVQCSNGYIIINFNLDNDWKAYFSSWIKYHKTVVGPIRNDQVNWHQWLTPASSDDSFLLSPQCGSCLADSSYQVFDDHSAYYLSALAFGCFSAVRGWPACDFDQETYQCYLCVVDPDADTMPTLVSKDRSETFVDESASLSLKAGICDFEVRKSTQQVSQGFGQCAVSSDVITNFKPSLGTGKDHCQCYKPNSAETDSVSVPTARLAAKHAKVAAAAAEEEEDAETDSAPTEYYLYQTDFEDGTYRIRSPGTYYVMEDIVFDFNAPPEHHDSPNSISGNYYWPTDEAKYPGAGQARDPFFLGYFAGITVESNDVVIELNGHTLRMSDMFFYQQPFFSVIELNSQPFEPQQGPGFFGAEPFYASEVTIRNGVLGLSSHHGLHGLNNKNIYLENVHVRDFQTHGVQINGFDGVYMDNVEIGPSTNKAFLNGNYGQIRLLLPTLAKIAARAEDDEIVFDQRDEGVTMGELVDRVVVMMDMMLAFVLHGTYKPHHEYWDAAVDAFLNPSGLPFGAVLYGLFLNMPAAGIFGWHVNDDHSWNAKLRNVHVHGLRHKGVEVLGFAEAGRVACNAFNGPLPARDLFGDNVDTAYSVLYEDETEKASSLRYVGSIITDLHIAMYYWGRDDYDNWPGIPFMGYDDKLMNWAMGEAPKMMAADDLVLYCNEDAMFHPSKGLLGIKISGVDSVDLDNVRISDLQDETPLGSELCGEVTGTHFGLYHFAQQVPYQVGFSMNMAMALTIDFSTVEMRGVAVEHVYSTTGLAFGVAGWYGSDVSLEGDIVVNDVQAGYLVRDRGLAYMDMPNRAAEACGVRWYDDETYTLDITWKEESLNAQQMCIDGVVGCLGEDVMTNFDEVMDSELCEANLPFALASQDVGEWMMARGIRTERFYDAQSVLFEVGGLSWRAVVLCAVLVAVCFAMKWVYANVMRKGKVLPNSETKPLLA